MAIGRQREPAKTWNLLGDVRKKPSEYEDDLLALMLDDFALDSQRSRDWSEALVTYAVAQRPANHGLLKQWVEQWKPLAYRGLAGVVELFGQSPRPLESQAVSAKVRAAHHAFLARCGLDSVDA